MSRKVEAQLECSVFAVTSGIVGKLACSTRRAEPTPSAFNGYVGKTVGLLWKLHHQFLFRHGVDVPVGAADIEQNHVQFVQIFLLFGVEPFFSSFCRRMVARGPQHGHDNCRHSKLCQLG